MLCKNCGNDLPESAKFCNKCGAKAEKERKCSQCGNILSADDVFCMECGANCEQPSTAVPTLAPPDTATGITAQAAFSEDRIAYRSDLFMLSGYYNKNNRIITYHQGYVYIYKYSWINNINRLYKVNQETAEFECITEFDEEYKCIYGVNNHGIFLYREETDKSTWTNYSVIANIGFDGQLLGQVKVENWKRADDGESDVYVYTWGIIIDDIFYYSYGYGVKCVNIRSGITTTIYEFSGETDKRAFCINKVMADADNVYFSIGFSDSGEWEEAIDLKWHDYLPYSPEYWYRYNFRSKDIRCLSSSKRDLRNIIKSPEIFCEAFFNESVGEATDNPDYVNDPNYSNIKVVDVVKGIMWTLEEDETLVARRIGQNQPILSTITTWKMPGTFCDCVYFDGKMYIIGYGTKFGVCNNNGDVKFFEERSASNSDVSFMEIAGDYLYIDFWGSHELHGYKRLNLQDCKEIEDAPEITVLDNLE